MENNKAVVDDAAGVIDQLDTSPLHLPRHDYPIDDAARWLASLEKSRSWALAGLDKPNSVRRADALSSALALAQARCATDPKAVKFETWEAWVTAMQTGSALFATATAAEGSTVTVRIQGQERSLPAIGLDYCATVGYWITSFYLALICRENERLETLAQVPFSLLRESTRGSGGESLEYIYHWAEALQCFWLGRPDMDDKLIAAAEGTDPQTARIDGPNQDAAAFIDKDLLLKIEWPPIHLLHRYLEHDHGEFNKALAEALQWHKEYWTTTEERTWSYEGLVALGPLAIACLAHDAGFPIDIESEYLPTALLKALWVGEIDT